LSFYNAIFPHLEDFNENITLHHPSNLEALMQNDLLKKHKENIRKIATNHGILSIKVFGSFARGENNIDSDIDLLVELEPKRSLLDMIAMKHELEDLMKRKVDVVTANGISPYLVKQIMEEAVQL
jgi:predicted nucleotidyltransferase